MQTLQNQKWKCPTMTDPLSRQSKLGGRWRSQEQANDQVPVRASEGVQRDMKEGLWRLNKICTQNTQTTLMRTKFKNRITLKTKRISSKRCNLLHIPIPRKSPTVLSALSQSLDRAKLFGQALHQLEGESLLRGGCTTQLIDPREIQSII